MTQGAEPTGPPADRVLLERHVVGEGVVAVVTLNDPERRNLMSLGMVEGIVAAFDEVERDEAVGAVVLAGAGPGFCAGADLGGLAGVSQSGSSAGDRSAAGLEAIYEGFMRVARCPLLTVAAVNGPAIGAGMNLALACDIRLVGERARFECRFGELGLHPGGGHTYLLARLVGPETAAAMLLCNEALRGAELVERHLAWRFVADEELLSESVALAGRAAGVPRLLSLRMKETLRAAGGHDSHEAALRRELEAQLWSLQQPFFKERLAALKSRLSGRRA